MVRCSLLLHRHDRRWRILLAMVLCLCGSATALKAQTADVTLRVEFVPPSGKSHPAAAPLIAVAWLAPLGGNTVSAPSAAAHTYRMVQENKQFDPHLLIVPVGSLVQFPNHDPFFHNVFSLYNGKRFDLGLYETGSERGVRFDREGVSYIFCDIHPEMGAVILALSTPYYAVSRGGVIVIPHVPPGRYTLNLWSESATQESQNAARRQVTVGSLDTDLGSVTLTATPSPIAHHANKFGESYPATKDPDSPGSKY
jgi:plastocyanin